MSCGCQYWIISGDCCGSSEFINTSCCDQEAIPLGVQLWDEKECPPDAPPPIGPCQQPSCCLNSPTGLNSLPLGDCEVGDTVLIYLCATGVFAKFTLTEGLPDRKNPVVSAVTPTACGDNLFVTVTGSGTISYQWYKGLGGDITQPVGIDDSTILQIQNDTYYWVRVRDGCGFHDTEPFLTSILLPEISELIIGICGTSATVDVLSSTGIVTFEWFEVINGVNTLIPINADTIPIDHCGSYFVIVGDDCGSSQTLPTPVRLIDPSTKYLPIQGTGFEVTTTSSQQTLEDMGVVFDPDATMIRVRFYPPLSLAPVFVRYSHDALAIVSPTVGIPVVGADALYFNKHEFQSQFIAVGVDVVAMTEQFSNACYVCA